MALTTAATAPPGTNTRPDMGIPELGRDGQRRAAHTRARRPEVLHTGACSTRLATRGDGARLNCDVTADGLYRTNPCQQH